MHSNSKHVSSSSFSSGVSEPKMGAPPPSSSSILERNQRLMRDHSWSTKKTIWNYNNNVGFSWPPRSYDCSFCKREFRSAQALGGHMNVHRRDRAMLRHSPPPLINLDLNFHPNPNPNPNFSTSPRGADYVCKFLEASVGLSLEIGKEDLDLELRLGYR